MRWASNPINKYGAIRTNGYASKTESERALELRLLQQAGEITELEEQVRYPLRVAGELVCTYVADFVYKDFAGRLTVEDVKGCRTKEYIIKRKLFLALYPGVLFREVTKCDIGRTSRRRKRR